MARQPETRLSDLIEAAIKVFTAKGYRRTQMSDVARAAGVSQGTLYNYVESKEALFYLILDRSFREDALLPARNQLPIRTPAMDAIVSRFAEQMAAEFRLPVLQRALSERRVVDARTELEAVVREYYEAMARTRRALDLIERSTVDLPELAEQLYLKIRRGRIDKLARYIESRIALGEFRPLPDPPTAARLLLETVAWFARHRHNTADSAMISD
ncbi:MAG TPA: helix-turn-helix domain-containing protein, partial [Candidatus Binataceae bacterium]|nr:helix-turn-helix domain-containing protein [Candidatus Binataceae bacterium]